MTPLLLAALLSAAPGKLVEVDGKRLHLHCTGKGKPTIVFEAGASAFAIDFALVQPELAKRNRVCSYDRAGTGWSEGAADDGRERVVTTLHALLAAAREKPPYVLVGASFGGLYVRLYQARHPRDVLGLVLIDPAHEDRLFTFYGGRAVAIAELSAEQLRSTFKPGVARLPRRSPQVGAPFDRLPPALYEERQQLDARLIASQPQSITSEQAAAGAEAGRALFAELREAALRGRPLGDRPLVVLTRGDERNQEREAVHASMAKLTTNFRHTVVSGAGHEIHLFEPAAVLQAVRDVLDAVKTGKPLPAR